MEATNYFGFLPNELLISCFDYLSVKELGVCSQVSKLFHDCAEDDSLWRKFFREKYPDSYKPLEDQSRVETKKNKAKFRKLTSTNWKNLYRRYTAGYPKEGMRCLIKNDALECFTIFKNVIYAADAAGTLYYGNPRLVSEFTPKGNCGFSVSYLAIDEDLEGRVSLIIGGNEGCVKILKHGESLKELTLQGHTRIHDGQIHRIEINEIDILTTSFSFKSPVHVWGKNSYDLKATLDSGPCRALAVSKDKIITGNSRGTIKIWDAKTYEVLNSVQLNQFPVGGIKVFKDKLYCHFHDLFNLYPVSPSLFILDLQTQQLLKKIDNLKEHILFTFFDNQIFYIKDPDCYSAPRKINILKEEILSDPKLNQIVGQTLNFPNKCAITSIETCFHGLVFKLRPTIGYKKIHAGLYFSPSPNPPYKG